MERANMPEYYHSTAAQVPDFDITCLNSAPYFDQWSQQFGEIDPRQQRFKQELIPIPPKIEPIPVSELDYLENPWHWPSHQLHPHHQQQHHHHPNLPMDSSMASYQPVGSPENQQLQFSDPPTPAAECQVTSTNLSPHNSPYSPHSDVGSYDGGMAGESYLPGESHFDHNELNEINIKGLTEEQLVSLTARDLNRICREMPEDIVKQLKKRRRTLKNRGYAYNSRVRRVTQKTALETERDDLRHQIQQLTEKCKGLEREADQWKKRAHTLESQSRGQL